MNKLWSSLFLVDFLSVSGWDRAWLVAIALDFWRVGKRDKAHGMITGMEKR